MPTRQRDWTLAAGILLAATTGGTLAQAPVSEPATERSAGGETRPTARTQDVPAPPAPASVDPGDKAAALPTTSQQQVLPATASVDPGDKAAALPTTGQPQVLPAPAALDPGNKAAALPTTGQLQVSPATAPVACAAPAPELSMWDRCKRNLQECFLGYKEEFKSPPLGYMVNLHGRTQVANGEAARMVLYEYDFLDGGNQLNQKGKDQLAKIAGLLPHTFFPVVIERTPQNPSIAAARRLAVMAELATAHGSFPVPPQRVIVGPAIANGLSGVEAVVVNQNLLRQTQAKGIPQGGPSIGAGTAGTTGSSTQGTSTPSQNTPQN